MKVVQIIPGSGGSFYCGNCMRDSKYIQAIRAQGIEVTVVPMYLPLFPVEENTLAVPVFYGAISLYLKQVFPLFRKAPAWVDKALNSKPMLKFAAAMANSTRSNGLEDMTLSMLMGEDGQQKDELEHLVNWLQDHYKADIIHISNALLLGLAHKLRERLNVPVICTLQDEDVWVDAMNPEFREKTWSLMREKAKDVDLFISVSRYFTEFMQAKLQLPDAQIATLPLGVDPADYVYKNSGDKGKVVGYLSRMCYDNGLDILVDAFILLKQKPGNEDCTLLLTGGHTADDHRFMALQHKKLAKAGWSHQVEVLEDFGTASRAAFFERVSALSVPVRNGEAFGIYLTEAMAAGIPIVQPALGAFPEIVENSQGGVIYAENSPKALAQALNDLLNDVPRLRQLSENAHKSIETTYNIHRLAGEMANLYRKTLETKHNQPC